MTQNHIEIPESSPETPFQFPDRLPSNTLEALSIILIFVYQIYTQIKQRTNTKRLNKLERKPQNITGTLAVEHELDSLLYQMLGATNASKISLGIAFNGTQTPYGYHFNKIAFSHIVVDDPNLKIQETLKTYHISNYLEIIDATKEAKAPIKVNGDYWLQVRDKETILALLKFEFKQEPWDTQLWKAYPYVSKLKQVLKGES